MLVALRQEVAIKGRGAPPFLEYTVASLKMQLPTWWQIHEAAVAGKNPYDCERKVTPRPPGAGLFVQSMEDLRADVVRNGLGVIEGAVVSPFVRNYI